MTSSWTSLSSDSIAAALLSFDYGGGGLTNLLVTPLQFIVGIVIIVVIKVFGSIEGFRVLKVFDGFRVPSPQSRLRRSGAFL